MPNPPLTPLILSYVEQMKVETCYVVTIQGPKVKRTTTGYYVSHDDETLILLDGEGKFRNVTIERIIRINFYHEGRAPF